MAALADALQQQAQAELTRDENAIVSAWQGILPAPVDTKGEMILPFVKFCTERKLRYCPARSYVVALFAKWLIDLGVDGIPAILQSIEELHDLGGYSNPVATYPVRLALQELAINTPAPRSWTKDEKISWPMLPADVRLAIARLEASREKTVRRMQNELADAKRKASEAEKIAQQEIEVMAKKQNYKTGAGNGAGPYSVTDMPLVDGDGGLGAPFGKPKDISKIVEKNHAVNDGFSGGLPVDK